MGENNCEVEGGGCGHDIEQHPVKVLKTNGRVGARFYSGCTATGCGCDGYVTPMPPPLPGERDRGARFDVPAEERRSIWRTAA